MYELYIIIPDDLATTKCHIVQFCNKHWNKINCLDTRYLHFLMFLGCFLCFVDRINNLRSFYLNILHVMVFFPLLCLVYDGRSREQVFRAPYFSWDRLAWMCFKRDSSFYRSVLTVVVTSSCHISRSFKRIYNASEFWSEDLRELPENCFSSNCNRLNSSRISLHFYPAAISRVFSWWTQTVNIMCSLKAMSLKL